LDTPLPTTPEALLAQVEWVRRLARTLVTGDERAADVAQETWLAALQRPPAHERNLRGWLTSVARNAARKLVRSESRRQRHETESAAGSGEIPSAAAMVERAELQRRVVAAVLALDEPTRSTLLWRYFQDLTPSAIAGATKVPVATVKTRLKRGLAALRDRLRNEFGVEGREWMAALAPLLGPRGGGIATAAAATTTAVGVGGVVAMTKLKLVAALVAVVGVGAAGWRALTTEPTSSIETTRATGRSVEIERTNAPLVTTADAAREGERLSDASPPASDGALVVSTNEEAAPNVLEGFVRDSSGAWVEGAEVFIGKERDPRFDSLAAVLRELAMLRLNAGEEATATHRVVTDAAGRFRVVGLARDFAWSIAAVHPDLGTAWRTPIAAGNADRRERLELVLEPGRVFHGRVVRADGTACSRARIEVHGFAPGREPRRGGGAHLGTYVADEVGNYRTPALPGVAFELVAATPEPPRQRTATPRSSGIVVPAGEQRVQRVDLTLDPLVTVHGRLLVKDGRSLSDALHACFEAAELDRPGDTTLGVFAMNDDPRLALGLQPPAEPRSSRTYCICNGRIDASAGAWSIDLVEPDLTHVAVVARKKLVAWAALRVLEDGRPSAEGPDLLLDLASLPPPIHGGVFVVRLTDAATGAAIPNGRIDLSIWTRDGNLTQSRGDAAAVDARGCAEIRLPCGQISFQTDVVGYASVQGFVTMRPGAWEERTLHLERARRSITGVVTTPNGAAASRASVSAFLNSDGEYRAIGTATRCDSNGRFELSGMPAGEFVVVVACDPFAPSVATLDASATRVEIGLMEGVALKVRAVARDDRPLGSFELRIVDDAGIPVIDELGRGFHAEDDPVHLQPGEYIIEVHVVDYEPNVSTLRVARNSEIEFGMHPIRH